MLAQAIQTRALGQTRPEPEILALEHQARRRGVKEHIAVALARDREAEGVLNVVEFKLAITGVGPVGAWASKDGGRHLVDLIGSVLDLDMEAGVCAKN